MGNASRGAPRIFHWGPRPKGRKSRPKAENGGSWGQGRKPPLHQLGGGDLRERCELPRARPPRVLLPLFSALTMASSDTIRSLIVDYHAAIGGKSPLPLAYAPECFRGKAACEFIRHQPDGAFIHSFIHSLTNNKGPTNRPVTCMQHAL